jgi:hypothetical protein
MNSCAPRRLNSTLRLRCVTMGFHSSKEVGDIRPDYRRLAWKKRPGPDGLLNSARSHEWQRVRHVTQEENEIL